MRDELKSPWLIAIWPGMGSVALTAGGFLIEQTGMRRLMSLPASEYFDIEKVDIQEGVARVGWLPSCALYGYKNTHPGGHDLLVFVGEAQPSQRGYEFCKQILQVARRYGVSRVYTFAAMATQIHPTALPRVFGVANEAALLSELTLQRVEILREGQISGLNGVMLAAAAELDIEGICLLGEIPFFAVSVPNPKASMRVLRVFSHMARLRLDYSQLKTQASALEKRLVELIDRMNVSSQAAGDERASGDEAAVGDERESTEEEEQPPVELAQRTADGLLLKYNDRLRIEDLFQQASHDRAKAGDLKTELDRLGAFREYEDRFLDLFRRSNS
ncbi:MAG: PAC2 family protein [Planctomycetota bacterium]